LDPKIICILENSWKTPEISELAWNLSFFHQKKKINMKKNNKKKKSCVSICPSPANKTILK